MGIEEPHFVGEVILVFPAAVDRPDLDPEGVGSATGGPDHERVSALAVEGAPCVHTLLLRYVDNRITQGLNEQFSAYRGNIHLSWH